MGPRPRVAGLAPDPKGLGVPAWWPHGRGCSALAASLTPHVADEDGRLTPSCAALSSQSPVTHRARVRGGLVGHAWPEALACGR